jgi:hypothetical protein
MRFSNISSTYPEDGGSSFLLKWIDELQEYTVSHPTRKISDSFSDIFYPVLFSEFICLKHKPTAH